MSDLPPLMTYVEYRRRREPGWNWPRAVPAVVTPSMSHEARMQRSKLLEKHRIEPAIFRCECMMMARLEAITRVTDTGRAYCKDCAPKHPRA